MNYPDTIEQNSEDRIISPEECANLLGNSEATLASWRCTGRYGLPYLKIGRHVKYRLSEVMAWLDTRSRGGEQ